ncbi:non-ribosomal peptide synthetase [Streptomyces sp. NPDC007205]|uniref:non-ribosomal peptide synthetase n=1 Tax=Streptomyces sp. NPDC007205 TaxID=3154316 RepID=UPI003405F748
MGTQKKITAAGERFQRPVSPNEWLYLAFEGATGAPFVIQLVVEGRGTIALGELGRAVARASEATPGARLAVSGRLWADTGQSPVARQAPDLEAVLRGPLAPGTGRSCEVVVVPGGSADADAPTALAFRAHHAAMDGRGLLGWTLDVFRALRGEEPVGAPSSLDEVALLEQLTGGAGSPAPRRPRQRARWRSPLGGPRQDSGSDAPHWARRTLDGVHQALVARIAAAVTDHAGTPARVMVPVDLRRHCAGLRASANLSLPVFLEGRPGRPWEAWQQELLRALADGAELAAGEERDAARLPQGVLRLLGRTTSAAARVLDRYPCTALVSHLGRIEPADVCVPGFEADTAYSLPVRVPLVPVSFTTLEFGRHTQLVVSAGRGRSVAAAASLLDAVCEKLSPVTGTERLSGGAPLGASGTATTLTALFREQATRTPDAIAMIGPSGQEDPAGQVTYAELDHRSDAVAAHLRTRGLGPGAVVALLDGRTPAAIAALWGILKAGAAYLPLDPTHPPARIAAVLADSGAALCLAGDTYQAAVLDDACPVLALESLPWDGAEPVDHTDDPASPASVAYVIYTSGSTGSPKGVQVEHRALTAYVRWARERYGVDAATRFGLFTSLAFDLTGTALFLPLLSGGSIALEPGEPGRHTLTALLNTSGVTALKLTPAHLDLMTSLGVTVPDGRIRTVVVGGEQLRGPAAARAQRLFGPDCRIFNEYGPTEAAIGCIVHTYDPAREADRPAVPIGLPVPGTGIVLLDADGRPSAEGELHLTGGQLARGYLGRPDLDRERFIRLADGTRAYRTGDLVRLTTDGTLEFLGRTDDQLSIRGFRIEPGEIEAVLERHPEVTRAVVTARPGPAGEPVLCAYVTTGTVPGSLDPEQIRAYTAGLLPAYLVPAAVRVLDAFPLTVNGKVDQRALPSPFVRDQHPAMRDTESDNPRAAGTDSLAAAVTKIWCRTLGAGTAEGIGPGDPFHQLGGDSLTLLLMLSDVAAELVHPDRQHAFQEELRNLLRDVTVERVCAAIRTANSGA